MAKSKKTKARKERRMASARARADKHKSGFESTCFKIPDGMKRFIPKEKVYRLSLVPFTAGKGNPFADEGDLYYERTYYNHPYIGPDNSAYVCLAKTYNKKCPVCEHRAELAKDPKADDDEVKALFSKERQAFYVFDHGDPDSGVQFFEISHHNFGKVLDKKLRADDEDEYSEFFDPDNGYQLKCSFEEVSIGSGPKFIQCQDIEFKKRKEALDPELYEDLPSLDDLLIERSYKDLKEIYRQTKEDDSEDDDEDEKPAKGKGKAKSKGKAGKKKEITTADEAGLEVGDSVEHEEHGECEIVKISKDGTSLTLEDEDGERHAAVGCDEVTKLDADDEEEEEDAKPSRKGKGKSKPDKRKTRGKAADEDDEEDDEDSEDSDDDDSDDDTEDGDEDDDEDEDEKPKRGARGGKKKSAKDDDDWEDDEDDEDDEEEDEDEPPKKRRGGKRK